MAVTLSHINQEVSRRRATTLPSNTAPQNNTSAPIPIPLPEHFRSSPAQSYQQPQRYGSVPEQHYLQSNTSPAQRWSSCQPTASSYANEPWQSMQWPQHYDFSPPLKGYQNSPVVPNPATPPSFPPRPGQIQHQPSSPHDSVHTPTQTKDASSPPQQTIEPDPLPPHSNPQSLTHTQAQAYTGPAPLKPLRLGADELWSASTGLAEYRIARSSPHIGLSRLSSSSKQNLLTVIRTRDGSVLGTVRFHTLMSQGIELSCDGGNVSKRTSLSHGGLVRDRWGWASMSASGEQWHWKHDRSTAGLKLERIGEGKSSRHAELLAKLREDELEFVGARLGDVEQAEIVLSAVAMAEVGSRGKS